MTSQRYPIRLTSRVIKGFGRGSRELGIPTANMSREDIGKAVFDGLEPGIYWGCGGVGDTVYDAAISIGYNPTYNNKEKTCEPHLIVSDEHHCRHKSSCEETQLPDFYGSRMRLSVLGYLRAELPFEGLDKLVQAIKGDITNTVSLMRDSSEVIEKEREWCKQVAVEEPESEPEQTTIKK